MNGSSAPQTVPGVIHVASPGGDKACEEERHEKMYNETFSKSIVQRTIQEYQHGKYTRKYIEVYVDFAHLNGFITNLEYLEFKNNLVKE